jgi:hypothetical protein
MDMESAKLIERSENIANPLKPVKKQSRSLRPACYQLATI